MPAWGLIPDSPLLYWGGRAFRGTTPNRRRTSAGRRGPVSFDFKFEKLVIYKPILNFELNNRRGMVGRYLHEVAVLIQTGAKTQVGVRTGQLRRSIKIQHIDGSRGQSVKIGSSLHYAYLHHEGTKPHLITPKGPNTTLRFRSGTRIVHTAVVRHPGTKANKYLTNHLTRRNLELPNLK
jgi:hypothetical protein